MLLDIPKRLLSMTPLFKDLFQPLGANRVKIKHKNEPRSCRMMQSEPPYLLLKITICGTFLLLCYHYKLTV